MMPHELLEVIRLFEKALAKKKPPTIKNLHRASQVLRILQVDYHDFARNEGKRACDPKTRAKWEQWTDPDFFDVKP
jgi:hypothetical protein